MVGAGGCGGGASDQGFVGDGVDHDRLLHEAIKELSPVARPASIEPKGELIEVELQVLVADRPLVGTQDPALQQGCDSMDAGASVPMPIPFCPSET